MNVRSDIMQKYDEEILKNIYTFFFLFWLRFINTEMLETHRDAESWKFM